MNALLLYYSSEMSSRFSQRSEKCYFWGEEFSRMIRKWQLGGAMWIKDEKNENEFYGSTFDFSLYSG